MTDFTPITCPKCGLYRVENSAAKYCRPCSKATVEKAARNLSPSHYRNPDDGRSCDNYEHAIAREF